MLTDTHTVFEVLTWDRDIQQWNVVIWTPDEAYARRIYNKQNARAPHRRNRLRKTVTTTELLADYVPGEAQQENA